MALVRQECPGCKKHSEPFLGMDGPSGWFQFRTYWAGAWRTFSACSADCIPASIESAQAWLRNYTESICQRLKDSKGSGCWERLP